MKSILLSWNSGRVLLLLLRPLPILESFRKGSVFVEAPCSLHKLLICRLFREGAGTKKFNHVITLKDFLLQQPFSHLEMREREREAGLHNTIRNKILPI